MAAATQYVYYDSVVRIDEVNGKAEVNAPFNFNKRVWVNLADVRPYMRSGNSSAPIKQFLYDQYRKSDFWGKPQQPAYINNTGNLEPIPPGLQNAVSASQLEMKDAREQDHKEAIAPEPAAPDQKVDDAAEKELTYDELKQNYYKHKPLLFHRLSARFLKGDPFDPNGARLSFNWGESQIERHAKAQHIVALEELRGLLGEAREAVSKTRASKYKALKEVYHDTIQSDEDLLRRLMRLRPLCFYGKTNTWLLRDQRQGKGIRDYLDAVDLHEYLHPDEARLSAMFGISNDTFLINYGTISNMGRIYHETRNVQATVVGVVGARLETPGVAEWNMLHRSANGRTKLDLFAKVVRNKLIAYAETENLALNKVASMPKARGAEKLCMGLYAARTSLILQGFLLRAIELCHQKRCRISVMGFGLGVWSGDSRDVIKAWGTGLRHALSKLPEPKQEEKLEKLLISYIDRDALKEEDADAIEAWCKKRGWNVEFSFTSSLAWPEKEDKVHVVSCYAWDGMSYQGNEYWIGKLSSSMDPATMSASTIPFVGTPEVNPPGYHRIRFYS